MTALRAYWWPGLLAVLALWAGSALNKQLPNPMDIRSAPFQHAVSRNASVTLRTGTVNVVGINASNALYREQEKALSKEGFFLVLDVEFTASRAPASVANLTLQSQDGRTFGGLPPIGTVDCGPAQPGIPLHCQVIFEVDGAALVGAQLHVPAQWNEEADDVAVIDLHIDDALAKDLRGRQTPIEVTGQRPVGAQSLGEQ